MIGVTTIPAIQVIALFYRAGAKIYILEDRAHFFLNKIILILEI
jgi:pyoverdine/dityrosine biosynthesis protein Dit1